MDVLCMGRFLLIPNNGGRMFKIIRFGAYGFFLGAIIAIVLCDCMLHEKKSRLTLLRRVLSEQIEVLSRVENDESLKSEGERILYETMP